MEIPERAVYKESSFREKTQAIEYLKSPQRPDKSARSKVLDSASEGGSCTEL